MSGFIALCYKLQGFEVLRILENATRKNMPPMLMQNLTGVSIPLKIADLFAGNRSFEIVPFNELNQLIENGFLTAEEKNLQDERNARESAQRTTIIVAVVSLLISTATSVGITYFNYRTYSTERKVSISNLSDIKYPIPVLITEVPKQSEVAASSSKHHSK